MVQPVKPITGFNVNIVGKNDTTATASSSAQIIIPMVNPQAKIDTNAFIKTDKDVNFEQTRKNISEDLKNHKLVFVKELSFEGKVYSPAHFEYRADRGETYGSFLKRYNGVVKKEECESKNPEIRKLQGDINSRRLLVAPDIAPEKIYPYIIPRTK